MIRRHALGCSTGLVILLAVGIILAPPTIRIVAILGLFLAYVAGLWFAFHRPLTETDLHCSAVDIQLDRERDERIRADGGGGFRV